jgi:hypothetical protein
LVFLLLDLGFNDERSFRAHNGSPISSLIFVCYHSLLGRPVIGFAKLPFKTVDSCPITTFWDHIEWQCDSTEVKACFGSLFCLPMTIRSILNQYVWFTFLQGLLSISVGLFRKSLLRIFSFLWMRSGFSRQNSWYENR